jgi:hypothetical protein
MIHVLFISKEIYAHNINKVMYEHMAWCEYQCCGAGRFCAAPAPAQQFRHRLQFRLQLRLLSPHILKASQNFMHFKDVNNYEKVIYNISYKNTNRSRSKANNFGYGSGINIAAPPAPAPTSQR